MAALITGFRETLEAAVLIAVLLVAVRRLDHAHLAQLAWYGLGTGMVFGVSVATGLAAVNAGVEGQALVTLQLVSGGLALLATTVLVLWMRRRGGKTAVSADDATGSAGCVADGRRGSSLPPAAEPGTGCQAGKPGGRRSGLRGMALAAAGVAAAIAPGGCAVCGPWCAAIRGRFFRVTPQASRPRSLVKPTTADRPFAYTSGVLQHARHVALVMSNLLSSRPWCAITPCALGWH